MSIVLHETNDKHAGIRYRFFQLQYTKVENDVIASSLGGKMNAVLNTAGRGDGDDDVGNVFLHEVL